AEGVVTGKGLDRKYWIDISYQQAMRRTEIAWIRGLLEELSSGHLPWDEPRPTPVELSNKPKESLGKRS
ncbi:PadR family transcriptional regulator, partial [Paenarthrobacter sp. RAF9]